MRRGMLVFLVLVAGCGGSDERRTVTIEMKEQMGSTQFGEAVLTEVGDDHTRVEVAVGAGGGDRGQAVRIYRGTCENLGDPPAYALHDAEEGESITELDVPLEDILDRGYALTVHESAAVLRLRVACGKLQAPPDEATAG